MFYFGTTSTKIIICRKIPTLAFKAAFFLYRPRPTSPQINGKICDCARQGGM